MAQPFLLFGLYVLTVMGDRDGSEEGMVFFLAWDEVEVDFERYNASIQRIIENR